MSARCGIALLMALVVALVVLSACAAVMLTLTTTRTGAVFDQHERHVVDGLKAGEEVLIRWMLDHADQVVLPPAGGPIPILHDRWQTSTGSGALEVFAYDGLAGIPSRLANGPLRPALPGSWSGLTVPTNVSSSGGASDLLERIDVLSGLRRFPAPGPSPETLWSTTGGVVDADPLPTLGTLPGSSLAEILSPHSDGRLNVNTASTDLLRSIFLITKTSGSEDLLQRRQYGQRITSVPALAGIPLKLVTQSDVWNGLIRVEWQARRRSWWVVVVGNSREVKIVQRHEIHE